MRGASSDPPEVASVLWKGWSGRIAWDVGGNLGQSVPQLLDLFDRVESFEPSTESFAVLALEWVYDPRVGLHRVALSDHDGVLDTSLREVCSETGQLVAMDMPWQDYVPGVSSPQEDSLPWGKELATRPVLCRSADSLISTTLSVPDFCKVDTEGHEVQILQGASDLLKLGKTGWLIEFHSQANYEQCVKILQTANYEVSTIRHPHYRPQSHLWESHGWIRATAR